MPHCLAMIRLFVLISFLFIKTLFQSIKKKRKKNKNLISIGDYEGAQATMQLSSNSTQLYKEPE